MVILDKKKKKKRKEKERKEKKRKEKWEKRKFFYPFFYLIPIFHLYSILNNYLHYYFFFIFKNSYFYSNYNLDFSILLRITK